MFDWIRKTGSFFDPFLVLKGELKWFLHEVGSTTILPQSLFFQVKMKGVFRIREPILIPKLYQTLN